MTMDLTNNPARTAREAIDRAEALTVARIGALETQRDTLAHQAGYQRQRADTVEAKAETYKATAEALRERLHEVVSEAHATSDAGAFVSWCQKLEVP